MRVYAAVAIATLVLASCSGSATGGSSPRPTVIDPTFPPVVETGFISMERGGVPGGDVVGGLERLAGLRSDGSLTEDEFAAAKARVLGGIPGAGSEHLG